MRILTADEGTSEIQASFALRELGKGALGVALKQLEDDFEVIGKDPKRAALAGAFIVPSCGSPGDAVQIHS